MNEIALIVFWIIMFCIMLVGYTLVIHRSKVISWIVLVLGMIGFLGIPLYAIINDILTK